MEPLQYVHPSTRFEKIPTRIFADSRTASRTVAHRIAELIRQKQAAGERCVLGLATGSSPVTVYAELVRLHREEGLSFRNVVTFNLDEYYPMQPDALQSYVRFMREHLFDHIDIPSDQIHIPDGTVPREKVADYCRWYEDEIRKAGGIDLQLLGIGRTGHIGFNEPGSGRDTRTRLITLDHITIVDAASDFFGEENVPRKAITMGVGTILEAREIVLMAWGEGKAPIIREAVEGPISDHVPATYLQEHPNTTVVLDLAAAAELTRVKTPWLAGEVQWDDFLVKKAVIWLGTQLQKPILKLTNRDYMDNGMGDLVTEYDTAYNINIRIFNELQRTITGWPGGKPGAAYYDKPVAQEPARKRVIIFSPHPDDDVISMGGTFIRLVDQGHDVHVAYQTSGNIAVFDDDVIRFADFVNDYHEAFDLKQEVTRSLFQTIRQELAQKKPGEVDSPEVQTIKGLIRRGEAKAACRYVGIPDDHVHFLDMPFYETGRVKKKPIGEEDVRIVRELIEAIRPHQIYAAGDLSDPHGTHRVCLDAIFRAIDQLKDQEWMQQCYVWLYRGAWQEWELEQIDMAVPLSPDELLRKRRAIFKHQSQKDRPLFPGHDSREFWQRAEARNRETARLYDLLGLPEYEALEAFKRYYSAGE
ncbi:MAG: glucosamine-6-phosphate deaminase [Bacteroidetes bacterium]|nr:MAG: glucosamine-6-phosphate deaminase [Bacteroidota bacterium]